MAPKCNNNTKQMGILTYNRNFDEQSQFFPKVTSRDKNVIKNIVTIYRSIKKS